MFPPQRHKVNFSWIQGWSSDSLHISIYSLVSNLLVLRDLLRNTTNDCGEPVTTPVWSKKRVRKNGIQIKDGPCQEKTCLNIDSCCYEDWQNCEQAQYLWGNWNCIAVELWKIVQFQNSSGNLALISTEINCTYTLTEPSLYEVLMTKFVAERLDLWSHNQSGLAIGFGGKMDMKMHITLLCHWRICSIVFEWS